MNFSLGLANAAVLTEGSGCSSFSRVEEDYGSLAAHRFRFKVDSSHSTAARVSNTIWCTVKLKPPHTPAFIMTDA